MPAPYYLEDGFSTIITFASDPPVKMYEKEVTPPGFDTGGPIDTTGMRNDLWRTKTSKSLVTMTECSLTVAYAYGHLSRIFSLLRVIQLITVDIPTGETHEFYGYLDKFIPDPHREGEQPTAKMTIVPTNEDADQVEQSDTLTQAP